MERAHSCAWHLNKHYLSVSYCGYFDNFLFLFVICIISHLSFSQDSTRAGILSVFFTDESQVPRTITSKKKYTIRSGIQTTELAIRDLVH